MGYSYCHCFIIIYAYGETTYGRYAGGFVIERAFALHYSPILPREKEKEKKKLICNDRCQEVNQVTTNFLLNFLKPSCKGFGVSVPGFGHSDIRGLVTYRSMVRREPHRLSAWITDNCANIV